MAIHQTAIIEEGAVLGDNVSIGPFCLIGAKARLHDGVTLHSHVVINGSTEIGIDSVVHSFAALGGPPQHLAYKGEDTKLTIGANVVIREHVTMNAGTAAGGGVTKVGDRGFFMIGAHIAHDCNIGNDVICANNAAVGGHVQISDNVFLGAQCGIHQFCRIGAHAYIGGCAAVVNDIIPYGLAFGNRAQLAGLNIVGMKRSGMGRPAIQDLCGAYAMLFANEDTFIERIDRVRDRFADNKEVMHILKFLNEKNARPLMTPAR